MSAPAPTMLFQLAQRAAVTSAPSAALQKGCTVLAVVEGAEMRLHAPPAARGAPTLPRPPLLLTVRCRGWEGA